MGVGVGVGLLVDTRPVDTRPVDTRPVAEGRRARPVLALGLVVAVLVVVVVGSREGRPYPEDFTGRAVL